MSNTEHITDIDVNDPNLSAAAMLENALFGDTAEQTADTGGEPSTAQVQTTTEPSAATPAPVTEVEGNAAAEQTPPVAEPEATVVLAKDGVHTIPYETLQKTREQEQYWKQQALESQQALQALKDAQASATTTQAQNNAEAAQAAIEASGNSQAVMELFGDFSEEAIAKGVQALIAQQVPNQIQAALNQALAPIQQQQQLTAQQTAEAAHFALIHEKHPDAGSIAESQEFTGWLTQQPSIVRDAYNNVLSNGTATQVVELLDLYKAQNNVGQSAQPASVTNEMLEKAKQAVQNAPPKVPMSVTDLPAGQPASVSANERLDSLSASQLLQEMENWTPEQIDAFTTRRG